MSAAESSQVQKNSTVYSEGVQNRFYRSKRISGTLSLIRSVKYFTLQVYNISKYGCTVQYMCTVHNSTIVE